MHRNLKMGLILALVFMLQFPLSLLEGSNVADAAAISTTRTSVHDPSIVKSGNNYYIFGSHMANAVSSDLASWSNFTTNINSNYSSIFSVGGAWAARGSSDYDISGNLWAPDVIYNPAMGKWCMYMSVNGSNYYSSIALATADSITGPYTYAGTVVYSGFTNSSEAGATDYAAVTGSNSVAGRYVSGGSWNAAYGPNAIDPALVYDKNGQLWMSYGSWFGGIFLLKLDNQTGLRDYSYTYPTAANSSDQYFGTRLSGGYGNTGEGSYIVWDQAAGYYYMYVSYGGLDATSNFGGYHIRVFRSTNIAGPYTDAAGNTAICTSSNADQTTKGIKLFGNYTLSSLNNVSDSELSGNGYKSPGHNSAFIDSGGQRYLVYHTRFNHGNEYHQVRVHQQFLNADGWPVTAVYEYLGSEISQTGYQTSEIVGYYDFINHGNSATTANTGMLPTVSVSLNADGTISGAYSGTWSHTPGTYYSTMVIGGVSYKGVFFKQYDESSSHKETMTFSLIGSNDQSVWGSKTGTPSSNTLDGDYYIKNYFSGLYLDVADGNAADGTGIQQYDFNGSHAQIFRLVSDGSGYYSILTGASNYTSGIDVENGSPADGTNIIQWTYWGGDMQKYEIVEARTGLYAIKTKASSSASSLEVYNWSTVSGGPIVQWTYWGGDVQLWYLEPAN
ncbi:family 43 glycosylhydrolase [Paenibacillus sp. S150]|uniref:family 43 glycosylhydrolase n=1 Tax=Paenibacillus sp. S150 TaxID=2749826 RepID=UPI001C565FDB|nr:RICIN domain-containing protein [Paenibacillus sp. S150]